MLPGLRFETHSGAGGSNTWPLMYHAWGVRPYEKWGLRLQEEKEGTPRLAVSSVRGGRHGQVAAHVAWLQVAPPRRMGISFAGGDAQAGELIYLWPRVRGSQGDAAAAADARLSARPRLGPPAERPPAGAAGRALRRARPALGGGARRTPRRTRLSCDSSPCESATRGSLCFLHPRTTTTVM